MIVFGLEAVTITLIVCVVGTILRVYMGKVKNPQTKFNPHVAIMSFMVALLISITIVAPVIDAVPDDVTQLVILVVIVNQVMFVMKAESITTAAYSLLHKERSNVT